MKTDIYLWCHTDRWFFIPYIQIGLEVEPWHKALFIEIGWLNKWNAIEIEISKPKKPF